MTPSADVLMHLTLTPEECATAERVARRQAGPPREVIEVTVTLPQSWWRRLLGLPRRTVTRRTLGH